MYLVELNRDLAEKIIVESTRAGISTGDWMYEHFPVVVAALISQDSRINPFAKNWSEVEVFEWLMCHIIPNEQLEVEIFYDHKELLWSK